MAQRLVRKVCVDCKTQITYSDPDGLEMMEYAIESLSTMDPQALKNEMDLRNVTQEQREQFTSHKTIVVGS